MALPEQITTREYQKFIDHAPGQTKVRVSVADPVASAPLVTTKTIENVTIASANVEQSHTFPANTLFYMLKARGIGRIQIATASGQSAISYLTVSPGTAYESPIFNGTTVTIYFQSPTAGLVIEMESWA
jgi:hypothetical protein